jgi:hypothetical protein
MGKMLEVFKQANPRTSSPADPKPVRPTPPHVAQPQAVEAEEDEIPYIEVGGRNTATEASAAVLASAPAAKPRSVALAARSELVYRSVRLDCGVGKPRWFAFQPQFVPEVIAAHDSRHAVSAQYEALLHQLLGPIANKPTLAVWFLGASPRCGATTVVLNLALTAARLAESPVTVVEANRERPALAQRVGLPGASGGVAWFQANKPANLRFVTGSESPGLSLGTALEMLQAEEGLILVDGPSLNDLPEGFGLNEMPCDAVYGVTSSRRSHEPICDFGRPMDGWIVAQ